VGFVEWGGECSCTAVVVIGGLVLSDSCMICFFFGIVKVGDCVVRYLRDVLFRSLWWSYGEEGRLPEAWTVIRHRAARAHGPCIGTLGRNHMRNQ